MAELEEEEKKRDPYITSNDPYGPVYGLMKQDTGPDYYEEQKRLDRMRRTNALGDAFRLLADTVGYNKGATVHARQPIDFETPSARLRENMRGSKERQRLLNINVEMQKAKQRQAEIEKEKANEEWERRNKTQFEQQKELLGTRHENTLGLIDQRQENALDLLDQRYKKQKELAGFTQGQVNARQAKLFDFREQQKALTSAKTGSNYELSDDDGNIVSSVNKGGIDKMVTAILASNDPEVKESYDVIVNKYGDGLSQEAQRRLFIQKWWNATPELDKLARSLDKRSISQPKDNSIQGQLNTIYNDQNMDTVNKKRRMLDILITAKYPNGQVPKEYVEKAKATINKYFK